MFHPRDKFQLSPKLKLGVGRGVTKNQVLKYAAGACLLIAIGLTANSLKILFSSHGGGQAAVPQVLGATDTKNPTNGSATVQFIEYTVQKGDTLFNISQKYNIDWTTLATINNIQSPFTLTKGQKLEIPN